MSYAAAYDFRAQIRNLELPLDMEAFQAGLDDAFNDRDPRLTNREMAAEIQEFTAEVRYRRELELQQYRMQRYGEFALDDLSDQYAFLSKHMRESGVVTVQSGLQYRIIREGDGKRPTRTDWVRVHFRGSLTDGSEFDSSYAKGEPATLPVSKLVAGWSEALQMMSEGAHWELVIPPHLGYGHHGDGNNVPANAVLIMDVELIEVVDPRLVSRN